MLNEYLDLLPEVAAALDRGQPVLALESTIIAHGMPYPENVRTAREVESIVRKNGATPATLAILKGKLKVGLSKEEIEFLGKGEGILKASSRDLPFLVAEKLNGAATVAASVRIAALAGIKVMATGGIGGVHRGADKTFDISADLPELARNDVAVVCAGAKSILDIGLTLEYLETLGVPVAGYQTDRFPAFFTRDSGFEVPQRVDSIEELANILNTKWAMRIKGGMVIANPIPKEHEIPKRKAESAISQALAELEQKGIKGKAATPFLLSRIEALTDGESLRSNIELVRNNVKLGTLLAVELSSITT